MSMMGDFLMRELIQIFQILRQGQAQRTGCQQPGSLSQKIAM